MQTASTKHGEQGTVCAAAPATKTLHLRTVLAVAPTTYLQLTKECLTDLPLLFQHESYVPRAKANQLRLCICRSFAFAALEEVRLASPLETYNVCIVNLSIGTLFCCCRGARASPPSVKTEQSKLRQVHSRQSDNLPGCKACFHTSHNHPGEVCMIGLRLHA